MTTTIMPGYYTISTSTTDVTTLVLSLTFFVIATMVLVWMGNRLYRRLDRRYEDLEEVAITKVAKEKGLDLLEFLKEETKVELELKAMQRKTFRNMLEQEAVNKYFPQKKEEKE